MNKEQIINKIENLRMRVKTPGRAFSKSQREEMRDEISSLSAELDKVVFLEDLQYIEEFEKENTDLFLSEVDLIKTHIDSNFKQNITEELLYVLEDKLKSINEELGSIDRVRSSILTLRNALIKLDISEEDSILESFRRNKKETTQKEIARTYRSILSDVVKLRELIYEVTEIKTFFESKEQLSRFVFLTDPEFSSASDFSQGFATVVKGDEQVYFAFDGRVFNLSSVTSEIPNLAIQRPNPDLIPFEYKEGISRAKYGFRDSKNEVVIPAVYDHASPFVNGFAKVGIFKKDTIFYGLIDAKGFITLECDFIDLDNVHNDIVLYRRHVYSENYVRTSSFNFDVQKEVIYLGLRCGYLIFSDVRIAIESEVNKIKVSKNKIPSLKTNLEVDNERKKIWGHKDKINSYFKYITNSRIVRNT